MIIKSLSLKNWMIFGGEQSIAFAQGTANITLVFGENMHGKTTLLNAIRWAMYGKALNRQGRPIPPSDLINKPASNRGETDVCVALAFQIDEDEFLINRQLDYSDIRPVEACSLKINGRVIDGGKIEQAIERVLPEQISQFMLFDGELLKEFEALVVQEGSAQANGIKNAIEDTLGIPILKRTEDAVDRIAHDLTRERNQELKKDSQSKLLAERLQEIEADIENQKNQRNEAKLQSDQYKLKADELREVLDQTQDALLLIEKKKLSQEAISKIDEKISERESQLKNMAKNLWIFPLREALKSPLNRYEKQLEDLNETQGAIKGKSVQAAKIKKSLEHHSCQTCGSEIGVEQQEKMRAELEEIESDLIESSDTDDLIWEIKSKIKKLNICKDERDIREQYSMVNTSLADLEIEKIEQENVAYDIDQQLKGVDEHTSILTRQKYDSMTGQIAVLQEDIKRFEDQFTFLTQQVRQIRNSSDYQRASRGSEIVSKASKAEQLKDVISNAVGLYRDEMRKKVEERATTTYAALTTEKSFDKLEINDSYGLKLIVDGNVVNRSAGAEQIVAMSLIESLNYNGRRKGPMIMDTPGGRLDRSHRANILNHLPKVVTQLGIFAHSGEFAEDDTVIDPKSVGARYRIERQSTFHSELVSI